jgi:hypothetical protein
MCGFAAVKAGSSMKPASPLQQQRDGQHLLTVEMIIEERRELLEGLEIALVDDLALQRVQVMVVILQVLQKHFEVGFRSRDRRKPKSILCGVVPFKLSHSPFEVPPIDLPLISYRCGDTLLKTPAKVGMDILDKVAGHAATPRRLSAP